VNVYAESSAVLSWLLGEERAADVGEALAGAGEVAASDLTLLESERALVRLEALGITPESQTFERRAVLTAAAAAWNRVRVTDDVIERARRPFPHEPLRSLDALHLSSALLAREGLPNLRVLSLDNRVRRNARALGFDVLPRSGLH
jgi:predicted nucleic acid-binding protein